MSTHYIKLVNMTSTEIFKLQTANIYDRLRAINDPETGNASYFPTHMGGLLGQKNILESKSVMRETRVKQ